MPLERFDKFLTQHKYFKNVSDKTLVYYRCASRSWEQHSDGDWKTWIVNLRQKGTSAVSIKHVHLRYERLLENRLA